MAVPAIEPEPAPRAGGARWELYRLLSEPVRLRLLALAAVEELAVGELAELLEEGQPNVSRHVAPLRQAGLVAVRKEGTRALVRVADDAARDPVVADALVAGQALCRRDGSLQRVAEVVRARDAASRAFFARPRPGAGADDVAALPPELGAYVAALAPLVTRRRLAVDAGTGDGGLLEVIARVFRRVVAFDREDAQLRRCAERIARRGFDNVELMRGEVESAEVQQAVRAHGGADVVFAARLLHHAPKPAVTLHALADLLAPGGAVVVLDYAAHEDESMRDQADLWLGFDAAELRRLARAAGLHDVHVQALPAPGAPNGKPRLPDAHLSWQIMVARRPESPVPETSMHASASTQQPTAKKRTRRTS